MGFLKWYKRDPHRAVIGMTGLTLEEVGAYNLLLDWMYIRDGKINDDTRIICGYLNNTKPQRWRRLRASLIAKKKIYVLGGFLHNDRADRELTTVARKAQRKFQRNAERRMNSKGAHRHQ